MVRFATIGTSAITQSFLKGASKAEGLELGAVFSRSSEKARHFALKHGAPRWFNFLEELARCEDIDAVYIASPNGLHYSQSMLMLEHGKHVLCEKPVTASREETQALQSAAKQRGLVFMEAIIPLHLPQITLLRDAVSGIGRVSLARFDFSQYSSKYPSYLAGELPNVFNPALCTGSLMDLGVYCVYPALYLFGKPQRIRAGATMLESGADGAGYAVFEYTDKQVILTHSKIGQSRIGCEIIGTRGTIVFDSISKLQNMRFIGLDGKERQLSAAQEKEDLMSYEAQDFCDAIEQREAFSGRLQEWNSLCLDVSGTLQEIRRIAGIHFPHESNPA